VEVFPPKINSLHELIHKDHQGNGKTHIRNLILKRLQPGLDGSAAAMP